jgi:alpha-glucosidase
MIRPIVSLASALLIASLAAAAPQSPAAALAGTPQSPGAVPAGMPNTPVAVPAGMPKIVPIDPEKDFFTKELDYHGIRIKAPAIVSDEALYQAYGRLDMEMKHLPNVAANLAAAGAELHIIGKDQQTSDLPEFRKLKGKPLPWYNGLTIDERTRGLGGLHTSCGEENLLKLPTDRYLGRDICIHEFAHNIRDHGITQEIRDQFDAQYKSSLAKGLWHDAYAATNPDEYFAELTMWYFGTHGDMHMTGPKPDAGPEGLKKYDPDAYALLDKFYSGRIAVPIIKPEERRRQEDE